MTSTQALTLVAKLSSLLPKYDTHVGRYQLFTALEQLAADYKILNFSVFSEQVNQLNRHRPRNQKEQPND